MQKKACDILVIGAGGGGIVAAARTAVLSDYKIIVVDKASYVGGGAAGAADFRVYGSQWQKDHGCDDHFNEELLRVMDETYWKLNRKLVLNTFKASGEFFDWMCSMGDDVADHFVPGRYVFDRPDKGPEIPIFNEAYEREGGDDRPQGHRPGMRTGSYTVKLMKQCCDEHGVEILLKHKAVDVVVEAGKIVAVIVEHEGEQIEIACKACIMSTGSWISNPKILEQVDPVFAELDPGPLMPGGHRSSNYTGDGFPMAEKAGALIDYDSLVLRPMGPGPKVPFGLSGAGMAMVRSPFCLQINWEGKRYTCEPSVIRLGAFDSAHLALYQKHAVTFCVFDQNTLREAAKPENALPPQKQGPNEKITWVVPFPENVDESIAGDTQVIRADTIEELAEKMGVPAENLRATIEEYNASAQNGFDTDCFKPAKYLVPLTGPYYAIEQGVDTDGAFGGVLVNENIQAYRKDGGLVEGLWVPGDFASGRFINDMGIKRQIINDLGWAFASGYIAAKSAVDYLNTI